MNKRLVAASKWVKHRIVHSSPTLRGCLPDTTTYSMERLQQYLNRYAVVFLKPAVGTGGRKIFQVRKMGTKYLIKMEHQQRTGNSLAEVDKWLQEVAQGKLYLIQQGISLAKWEGRPVDLRTILQLNEQKQWECTGMFSKSAGKNLAVTNVCIGGSAHTVEEYLQAIGYTPQQSTALMKRLETMSLGVAKQFGNQFRNTIYGLDIGLDTNGKLWLIEVNTVPTLYVFKLINRLGMYNRSHKLWMLNRVTNIEVSPGLRKKYGWPLQELVQQKSLTAQKRSRVVQKRNNAGQQKIVQKQITMQEAAKEGTLPKTVTNTRQEARSPKSAATSNDAVCQKRFSSSKVAAPSKSVTKPKSGTVSNSTSDSSRNSLPTNKIPPTNTTSPKKPFRKQVTPQKGNTQPKMIAVP